jgi:DNA-binding NarL/FixJ family response regulator
MLTELITSAGPIEVVGVGATESAAIESIRALKPDVVILDLQLASGSGTEVLRAVRSAPELAGVRLLITSNHTAPQLRAGCLQLGADGFYDKVKELGPLTARLGELAAEKQRAS